MPSATHSSTLTAVSGGNPSVTYSGPQLKVVGNLTVDLSGVSAQNSVEVPLVPSADVSGANIAVSDSDLGIGFPQGIVATYVGESITINSIQTTKILSNTLVDVTSNYPEIAAGHVEVYYNLTLFASSGVLIATGNQTSSGLPFTLQMPSFDVNEFGDYADVHLSWALSDENGTSIVPLSWSNKFIRIYKDQATYDARDIDADGTTAATDSDDFDPNVQ